MPSRSPEFRFSPESLFFRRAQRAAMRQAVKQFYCQIEDLPDRLRMIVTQVLARCRSFHELAQEQNWTAKQAAQRWQQTLTQCLHDIAQENGWTEQQVMLYWQEGLSLLCEALDEFASWFDEE
jgi:hypothetical protein